MGYIYVFERQNYREKERKREGERTREREGEEERNVFHLLISLAKWPQWLRMD